jgi:hypothetical protein
VAVGVSAPGEADASPRACSSASGGSSAAEVISKGARTGAGPLTFTRLKWTSFFHSLIYLSLIVCALAGLAGPTMVLGWTHGILWIVMALACIAAVRGRVIPMRVGVAVAVLGGLGPFIGSYEFVREQGRRKSVPTAPDH